MDGGVRVYESSVLLRDAASAKQMNDFISRLMQTSTKNIAELEIDTFNDENALLDGHEFVEKVSPQKLAAAMLAKTDVAFEIPIALTVAARLAQFNKKLIITQSRYSAKVAFRMSGFFSNAASSASE